MIVKLYVRDVLWKEIETNRDCYYRGIVQFAVDPSSLFPVYSSGQEVPSSFTVKHITFLPDSREDVKNQIARCNENEVAIWDNTRLVIIKKEKP